jgi:hypothetical protein
MIIEAVLSLCAGRPVLRPQIHSMCTLPKTRVQLMRTDMKARGEWGTWVWLEWVYLVLGAVMVISAAVVLLTDPTPAWTWWLQGVMGIIFVGSAVQLLRRPRDTKPSSLEHAETEPK